MPLPESGKIASQAEIARREGISRARVTQVMGMLRLVPEIQEQILSMPDSVGRPPVTERMLRHVETVADSRDQLWESMEKSRPNIFRMKGRKSRHQLKISGKN